MCKYLISRKLRRGRERITINKNKHLLPSSIAITQFDDWKSDVDESETTVYRRSAVLLDYLFRNTNVIMEE